MRENLQAALCIVTAMMVLGISDNYIGEIAGRMSVWQYHVMRSALVMPLIAAAMLLIGQGASIWPRRPGAVLTRSALGVAALLVYFAAIPAVSVSIAAAGLFTSPIWVTVFSIAIFGERVGARRLAGMALGFAGVCLVLRIGSEPLRAMAVAPMLAGAAYALSIIWTRRYCRDESAGSLAFWQLAVFLAAGLAGLAATPWIAAAVAGVDGTAFMTMAPVRPSLEDVLLVLLLGGSGALGILLLAIGYRGAPPTQAALFDYSFLFWVPLFSWLLWDERLPPSVALGMALIVVAGALAIGAPSGSKAPSRA